MIVNIPENKTDDPIFLTALNGMLASMVEAYHPNEIYFIRIDRWFDHKWLGYSGKAHVAFYGIRIDTALDPIWREKLTFPAFNPNRVLEQISYQRVGDVYRLNAEARTIHSPNKAHSARNLQNRVTEFTQSGLFVWFSSDTQSIDHASVMAYSVEGKLVGKWFASFIRNKDYWKVHRVKGVNEEYVRTWFPLSPK